MLANYNVQSPNFGMALKISKGAQAKLKDLPMSTIEKLQKAGEDLKDTRFYHVKVDDNLSTKLTADKDAYFGPFKTEKYSTHYGTERNGNGEDVISDRILMIDKLKSRPYSPEGYKETIAGVARYVPYGESEPFFDVWGLAPYNKINDTDSLACIAKILDGVAVDKYAETAEKLKAANLEKTRVSEAVDKLLDTFAE